MENVIRTYQLNKEFKEETALQSFDFALQQGEICALIGKNGAGKSTFFKMLSGQIAPTNGEIQLFGKTKNEHDRARQRMGFMIEEPKFFGDFTAEQNLEYFRIQRGVVEKARISEVLKMVGLSEHTKKKFHQYSMGMKQRLGLALCLLSNPDCLVLDEPTNGLDPEGINEIRRLLLELNQERQITILISSHILSELQLLANRFVFIHGGKMVEDISKTDLENKCKKQLKIKVNDSAKTSQLLERTFRDIDYRCLVDGWIIIHSHVDQGAEINALLHREGISVSEVRVEDVTLEDYFLKLVGGTAND